MPALDTFRRGVCRETSLGVCTLPLAEKIIAELIPRGCACYFACRTVASGATVVWDEAGKYPSGSGGCGYWRRCRVIPSAHLHLLHKYTPS